MTENKINIFYSYSHKDEELKDILDSHLAMLKRRGLINDWHDRKIIAGEVWDKRIKEELENADIILLLISSFFLSSDYCFDIEVKRAVELHNLGKAILIPIAIRECDWEGAPFEKIQGLPTDLKPVVSKHWHNYDEAYNNIVQGLKNIINKILEEKKVIPQRSLEDYLLSIQLKFHIWRKRHIFLKGEEVLKDLKLYAIETDWDETSNTDRLTRERRHGTILDLISELNEKRMILLGEAGAGKSTSLQYIAYRYASDILKSIEEKTEFSNKKQIPIYIELKTLKEDETVLNNILNKISFVIEPENSLYDGNFIVILDGVNEVLSSLRNKVISEIENILNTFTKTFFLISSRPNFLSNGFNKTPKFALKELDDYQIDEFINSNCNSAKYINLIKSQLNNNNRLKRIISTPLKLYILIKVVENTGSIPENESLLIKTFINSLYHREINEKDPNFNSKEFHYLITYLAFAVIRDFGSNNSLPEHLILKIVSERKIKYSLDCNLVYFLSKAEELRILIRDEDYLSFSHQLYLEYFAADELLNTY